MAASEPHGVLTAMDGAVIPYRAWGDERSKLAIVLLHGAGAYSRWYENIAAGLSEHGIATFAYDQRGFGNTAGPRGHSPRFSYYLDDCALAMSAATARWPLASVVLCGHGFGALVALRYCLERAGRRGLEPSSLILIAPWIKDKLPIRKREIIEGLVRSVTRPTHTHRVPISVYETSDPENPELLAAVDRDPLIVREVSGRWWVIGARAKIGLLRLVRNLKLPVLQVEVTDETVLDSDTNRRLFAAIGSEQKRLAVLPGFHHEVQFERDVGPLVETIADFLGAHTRALA